MEDMYDFADQQQLDVDTLIHENGAAQLEINFNHGDPLAMADQVFVFKRTVRETAQRYNMYATFMAKPMQREPGSAMHIHQSVIDLETGKNIFATDDGQPSQAMMEFMGGSAALYARAHQLLCTQRKLIPSPCARYFGTHQPKLGL